MTADVTRMLVRGVAVSCLRFPRLLRDSSWPKPPPRAVVWWSSGPLCPLLWSASVRTECKVRQGGTEPGKEQRVRVTQVRKLLSLSLSLSFFILPLPPEESFRASGFALWAFAFASPRLGAQVRLASLFHSLVHS